MKDLTYLDKYKQPKGATSLVNTDIYRIHHPKIKGDWFWVEVGTTDGWEWIRIELWTIVSTTARKSKPRDRFVTPIEVEYLRSLFWDGVEVVGQYHPCGLDNTFCVHLMRKLEGEWYPKHIEIKPIPVADEPAATL